MNAFNRAIDRFCAKHPKFGIPNLMLYLVIGNVVVYLFGRMDTTGLFAYYLYFSPHLILQGQVWRIFTFLLVPGASNLLYLFLSLYFYYFIGTALERAWGAGRFTIYYFLGVILTIIYGFVIYWTTHISAAITTDYINLSIFFAFATMYPDQRVLLFFFIPIKIKWLALLDGALFIYSVITSSFPFNLLPVVALLNYLIFFGGYLFGRLRPYRYKASKTTINFKRAQREQKRAQKQAQKETQGKPYTRKCAVCGRTDADYPDLEFRYCSRCKGYHCFCQDHINNHVHFDK